MSYRHRLSDEQWAQISEALPGKKSDAGRTATDNRTFVEGVMWLARTGSPWRDLPAQYGKWATAYKRFQRWSQNGVWQMIFNTLAVSADTEWLMIDGTIIRAHQHAAGAKGGNNVKP
jgi:transposase